MKRLSMILFFLLCMICVSAQVQNSFLTPERKIQIDESKTEITVRANVKGCSVYLNGIYKGTTPLKIKNLIPGNFQLKLEKDCYETVSTYIKVSGGISYDYLVQMMIAEKPSSGLPNQ